VNNIEVEKTIKECQDIRRFSCVRNVKGGAQKNGQYLGKTVRWYYASNEPGYIAYSSSGNKVAETDGAKPLMKLPNSICEDIDYQWYINKANKMLKEIGAINQQDSLF